MQVQRILHKQQESNTCRCCAQVMSPHIEVSSGYQQNSYEVQQGSIHQARAGETLAPPQMQCSRGSAHSIFSYLMASLACSEEPCRSMGWLSTACHDCRGCWMTLTFGVSALSHAAAAAAVLLGLHWQPHACD